jgi:hypothetical protein
MLAVLEGVLLVAVIVVVVSQVWAILWKAKIVMVKVAHAISANPVVCFLAKVAMFAYFSLIVPAIDRAIN